MSLSVEEAYDFISGTIQKDAGRFYGPVGGIAWGAGMIFSGVKYPRYITEKGLFGTARGLVYVVTHECDMTQENAKAFNDDVAIIPIIPFREFVEVFLKSAVSNDKQKQFLSNLVHRYIYRLIYLVPFKGCDHGAVMFLNQMSSIRFECLEEDSAMPVTALTEHGRRIVDWTLQHHFFRPTQNLPHYQSMSNSIH